MEKRAARRARVASALAYPLFMACVGGVVVLFLLTFIVPTLTGLFDSLGAALPWPTRLLLAGGDFLRHYWWAVLLCVAALALLASRWLKKDRNYQILEKRMFRLPVLGPLWRKLLLALTFRSMAVMVGGGVTLSRALQVTAQGLGRSVFGVGIRLAADMVAQGRSLAEGLGETGLFPPVCRRMIAVGRSQRDPGQYAGPPGPVLRGGNRPEPVHLDLVGRTDHNPDGRAFSRIYRYGRPAAHLRPERPGEIKKWNS